MRTLISSLALAQAEVHKGRHDVALLRLCWGGLHRLSNVPLQRDRKWSGTPEAVRGVLRLPKVHVGPSSASSIKHRIRKSLRGKMRMASRRKHIKRGGDVNSDVKMPGSLEGCDGQKTRHFQSGKIS